MIFFKFYDNISKQFNRAGEIAYIIAGVAQSVEQLIRNQQVAGSNPVTSSKKYRYPFGWRFFIKGCLGLILFL